MLRLLLALALLLLPLAATAADVEVTVERGADGRWTADYAFHRQARAWVFTRSGIDEFARQPWRPKSVKVLTEGVRLERHGPHDVLVAERPLRTVRLALTPFGAPLVANYVPALTFSDGGLALYIKQFGLRPLARAEAAAALPAEIDWAEGLAAADTHVTLRTPGAKILLQGQVREGVAEIDAGADTYAYVGAAPLVQTPAVAAVIDPGLPPWIAEQLNAQLPVLLARYAERLGPSAIGRPTVFAAWAGAAHEGGSMNGGVLSGLVVMTLRGDAITEPHAGFGEMVRWFFAHEAAHFWLGQTVRYGEPGEAWITEGGADLLAIRTVKAMRPDDDTAGRLQKSLDGCVKLTGPGEALSGASGRGEHQAHYDCGALLLLAAEGALRRRDPRADALDFWRGLIEAHRASGVVDEAAWLAAFQAASGDAALTAEVRRFVDAGVDDPAAFLAHLFDRTGVAYVRDEAGRLKFAARASAQ
ncbi:MAG TPA: hypothetical protein VEA79_08715 [Phenylobacterium sp.]|nr:hypothetical protein [Phenylobacterium sp.]